MVKRSNAVVLCAVILLIGLCAGFFLNRLLPARSSALINSAVSESVTAGDEENHVEGLVDTAIEAAAAFQAQDFATLAAYIDPDDGVTFTPNTTVDRAVNLTFTAQQVAGMASSSESFIWGTYPDTASPISLTFSDYISSYVWDVDYLSSLRLSVDATLSSGNAMENLTDAYPGCRYVEFYNPGQADQTDWSSLRLVFRYKSGWYLVGVVHSEWSA